MRSLFLKTLLWFIGTALLTMILVIVAAALTFNAGGQRQPPFGMLLQMQLTEARHAYETGGPSALKDALDRFQRITKAEGIFTDGRGRDLVTGEDRSDLVLGTQPRPVFPVLRRDRAAIARRSPDGKYWIFLQTNRTSWIGWFFEPQHYLLVFCILVLPCYAFARHLTRPVNELQRAVECFGTGDFSTRVRSTRRDEIGQLARTFDKMADRIETLLKAERRLLQDISHELRSPLARLNVAIELARSSDDPKDHLDRIEKESNRLNTLVGELLEVTRAEGDPTRTHKETLRLDQLVAELAGDAQIEAGARGCKVEFQAAGPVTIQGNPELLRRAIENVLRNAIRYAPEGTTVAVRVDGSRIRIRDQGPGVPEESIGRIFDAFYRVDSDRDRASGGVGLGLAIARRAIEAHNGTIQARNANPGLEVTIAIPA